MAERVDRLDLPDAARPRRRRRRGGALTGKKLLLHWLS